MVDAWLAGLEWLPRETTPPHSSSAQQLLGRERRRLAQLAGAGSQWDFAGNRVASRLAG